ncbi:LysR family transcriptional regulator [Chitinimonas koreensis]|uniref:LysR family transcriptional regulator n=1 Tax=Chitinimonas koreensis TaxID=356302 RepID=UPI00048D0E45|nr:LysR family transcriptional regulator [Chitinimonas koreensis]QNM96172.1 LysR family transcriptional regulator [Chitinimonas koreensis]
MIALDDLRLLIRIEELGNLSAAARQLGWLPASASAALKRVEGELGARLFERTTRSMRASPAGRHYLAACREALAALEAGAEGLAQDRAALAGTVRIAAPSDLGRTLLRDWLDQLQAAHPQLRVTVRLGDQLSDLLRDDVDFALRYGQLADSALLRRPLANVRRLVVGAPAYFARRGRPASPAELADHNCLVLLRGDAAIDGWTLLADGRETVVNVAGDRQSDDGALLRDWALAGHGLCYKSWFDVAGDVAAGRLEAALPAASAPEVSLQLVSLARRHRPRRLEACADFLAERCAEFAARHPFPA